MGYLSSGFKKNNVYMANPLILLSVKQKLKYKLCIDLFW